MPQYTADHLNTRLLQPLQTHVTRLSRAVRQLRRAEQTGQIGPAGVTLPASGPVAHLEELTALCAAIDRKLADAAGGRLERLEAKRLRQAAYRRRATHRIRG